MKGWGWKKVREKQRETLRNKQKKTKGDAQKQTKMSCFYGDNIFLDSKQNKKKTKKKGWFKANWGGLSGQLIWP